MIGNIGSGLLPKLAIEESFPGNVESKKAFESELEKMKGEAEERADQVLLGSQKLPSVEEVIDEQMNQIGMDKQDPVLLAAKAFNQDKLLEAQKKPDQLIQKVKEALGDQIHLETKSQEGVQDLAKNLKGSQPSLESKELVQDGNLEFKKQNPQADLSREIERARGVIETLKIHKPVEKKAGETAEVKGDKSGVLLEGQLKSAESLGKTAESSLKIVHNVPGSEFLAARSTFDRGIDSKERNREPVRLKGRIDPGLEEKMNQMKLSETSEIKNLKFDTEVVRPQLNLEQINGSKKAPFESIENAPKIEPSISASAALNKAAEKSQNLEVDGHVVKGRMASDRLSTQSLNEITGKIQQFQNGSGDGQIKIRLKPDHLGELRVTIKNAGNQVALNVQASSEGSKKIIEESLSYLKENLANQNLNLAKFEVSLPVQVASNLFDGGKMNFEQSSYQNNGNTQQFLEENGFNQSDRRSFRETLEDRPLGSLASGMKTELEGDSKVSSNGRINIIA